MRKLFTILYYGFARHLPKSNRPILGKFAKDLTNLAGKNIVFNGVHLKGTGGGSGIPGISFQDAGGVEKIVFKSCIISDLFIYIAQYFFIIALCVEHAI